MNKRTTEIKLHKEKCKFFSGLNEKSMLFYNNSNKVTMNLECISHSQFSYSFKIWKSENFLLQNYKHSCIAMFVKIQFFPIDYDFLC